MSNSTVCFIKMYLPRPLLFVKRCQRAKHNNQLFFLLIGHSICTLKAIESIHVNVLKSRRLQCYHLHDNIRYISKYKLKRILCILSYISINLPSNYLLFIYSYCLPCCPYSIFYQVFVQRNRCQQNYAICISIVLFRKFVNTIYYLQMYTT